MWINIFIFDINAFITGAQGSTEKQGYGTPALTPSVLYYCGL